MRHAFRFILACVLLICANCALGESTKGSSETYWWIDMGAAGWADAGGKEAWAGASGFTLENDLGLFTLRNTNYIYREEGFFESIFSCAFSVIFGQTCEDKNVLKVEEWGLLYGGFDSEGKIAFSAGVSRVKSDNTKDTMKNYTVYGLPLELYWRPAAGKHFGVALMARANFNKEDSFAGLYLLLPVGKLK